MLPRRSQSSENWLEERPGPLVVAFGQDQRFAPEQRRHIPVDDRAGVVLVEHPVKPFAVDLGRFLLAPDQILARVRPQLLSADVQVAILLPEPALGPILGMLVVNRMSQIVFPCRLPLRGDLSPETQKGRRAGHVCRSSTAHCVVARSPGQPKT